MEGLDGEVFVAHVMGASSSSTSDSLIPARRLSPRRTAEVEALRPKSPSRHNNTPSSALPSPAPSPPPLALNPITTANLVYGPLQPGGVAQATLTGAAPMLAVLPSALGYPSSGAGAAATTSAGANPAAILSTMLPDAAAPALALPLTGVLGSGGAASLLSSAAGPPPKIAAAPLVGTPLAGLGALGGLSGLGGINGLSALGTGLGLGGLGMSTLGGGALGAGRLGGLSGVGGIGELGLGGLVAGLGVGGGGSRVVTGGVAGMGGGAGFGGAAGGGNGAAASGLGLSTLGGVSAR